MMHLTQVTSKPMLEPSRDMIIFHIMTYTQWLSWMYDKGIVGLFMLKVQLFSTRVQKISPHTINC